MAPVEPSQESTVPPPTEECHPSPDPSTARVYGNLLFYRLPPIADRAFLETVLRTKNIGRSLFFGTGLHRTALVELTNKEEAMAIYEVLRFSSPPLESDPTIPSSTPSLPSSSSSLSGAPLIPVSGLNKAARRLPLRLERDVPLQDSIPLAECYLHSPPAFPLIRGAMESGLAAEKRKAKEEAEHSAHASSGASSLSSYAYLQFLRYRDHRILLAWSPLAVEAFYQSGGLVPTKHTPATGASTMPAKTRPTASSDGTTATTATKRPREERSLHEKKPTMAASTVSPAHPTVVFPKDCCQKCGSPSHFTRRCTGGVVVPPTAATMASSPVDSHTTTFVAHEDGDSSKGEETKESAVRKHGASDTTTTAIDAVVVPAAASPFSHSSTTTRHTEVKAHPPSSSSFPSPSKENKDQCKHCGSTDHFSRHCPSK